MRRTHSETHDVPPASRAGRLEFRDSSLPSWIEGDPFLEILAIIERVSQGPARARRFHATAGMSDEALLQLIRDDNIDVLVEVRGHMVDRSVRSIRAKGRACRSHSSAIRTQPESAASIIASPMTFATPSASPSVCIAKSGPPQVRLSSFSAVYLSAASGT